MSGSETGVITSREAYANVGPLQSPSTMMPNMHLAYSAGGSAVYKPVATTVEASQTFNQSSGNGDSSHPLGINMNMGGEPMKRKRGRPRKYGPEGSMHSAFTPAAPSSQSPAVGSETFSPPAPPVGDSASLSASKKARGRPPGSSKKQQMEALGSAGVGFTPYVITINVGEDVAAKIMAFCRHGRRTICILSANGSISNVTLRQSATSGGTVTYEGLFEILSLSGSFLLTETGGQRSRIGGLSVSLSGPDGRVLGGGVAGVLTAATPVQVIVGSFVADGRKERKKSHQMEPLSALSNLATSAGATVAISPPSHGSLSESSGEPGSPLNQSTGVCNNSGMSSVPWK